MCVTLLVQEGFAGYGIYWALLELLRDAPRYRYTADEKILAYVLHAPDLDQVKRVLRNFGLFDFDEDGLFFSPWLMESLGAYDEQKKKLQEAGRKGAARRWAHTREDNGQAMATPSGDDGQAMAYNITQRNLTELNETQPTLANGEEWRSILSVDSPKVTPEYMEMLVSTQKAGHACGYVAQVCLYYGMTEAVCEAICERSDNASVTHPLYRKFCALVGRIEQEKWVPKHPANFFLSKLLE